MDDTKYIKKLTLDFKSFAELYKNNFSSLIVIFHINKDISLFEISDIMENFINSVGIEKIILFVLIFNVVLIIPDGF